MSRIRLSPSAGVTVTPAGVVLRSDLGAVQITGADVGAFVDRIVPLCDGAHDRAAIRSALGEYSPASVDAFLDLLENRRLIEQVPDVEPAQRERWGGQEEFLRRWPGGPADPTARLAGARVIVAGIEPWGAAAAVELSAAGLGAIHLVDDDATAREAAASRIRDLAPSCRVDASSMRALDAGGVTGDLLVAALPPEDAAPVEQVARFAQRAGTLSLWSHVAGATMILGPLVVPGRTACRICAAAEGLNPPLTRRDATRPGAWLMAQILGHLLALEAIKAITEYTHPVLAGRLLIVDPRTLETTMHTLVRLPWCRVCGRDT